MPRIEREIAKPHRPRNPYRNDDHRLWIKGLPCLGCGRGPPCDPAHIRFATADQEHRHGTGLKPADSRIVPLCRACHDREEAGKVTFWGARMAQGVSDPVAVAQRLWKISGDTDKGFAAIAHARPGLPTAARD